MDHDPYDPDMELFCDLCREPVVGRKPWILLNRYAVSSGASREMIEVVDPDNGECVWEVGPTADPDYVTGTVLCWPVCAGHWIEAKMVHADTTMKMRGPDG